MSSSLLEMAVNLVQSQCSTRSMTNDELTASLHAAYHALRALQDEEARLQQEGDLVPLVAETSSLSGLTARSSIQKNRIVCLECGHQGKMLSGKHLQSHGLDGREYRMKWGIPLHQPLCAKSLTVQRKKMAKERGLPDELRKFQQQRKENAEAKKGGQAQGN